MGIREILNEVKLLKISVKQLDKTTFLGFVSGLMAAQPKNVPITTNAYIKADKKMPIWDRLAKAGLLTVQTRGDEDHWFLTKKGTKYAAQLVANGDLYNPNKHTFK